MKNLKVVCIKNAELQLQVLSFCLDADNGVTYILSNNFDIYTVASNEFKPVLFKTIHGAEGKVISFEYLVEANGVLIIFENGQIILEREDLTKLLYQHDCHISSASLSPNQDLLVLADEKHNLQLMIPSETSFDLIHKLNSLETNDSLYKPVGVGWGSKETQFFGLDGRQTQKSVEPKKTESDSNDLKDIESSEKFINFNKSQERTLTIDWRGDSQLFATLSYLPDLNKHCLKVWNKRLELQYMSDKLIEIQRGILSYVPNGQFICCAQRRESQVNEITFFEKNGLVRHRFSLPTQLTNSYIQTVTWSPNSEILALVVKQFKLVDEEVCFKNVLLLYTMQNWHYYLKLSTYLDDDCDYLIRWNPNITNQLHLLTTNGHYIEYDICSCVDYCKLLSTVFVVDGNKILITPLEVSVIPPPMCSLKLEYDNLIYKIGTQPHSYSSLCILFMNGEVFLTYPPSEKTKKPELMDVLNNLLYPKYSGYMRDANLIQVAIPLILESLEPEDYQFMADSPDCIVASKVSENGCEIITVEFYDTDNEPLVAVNKKYDYQQVMGMKMVQGNIPSIHLIFNDSSREIFHFEHQEFINTHHSTSSEDKLNYAILDLDSLYIRDISHAPVTYDCVIVCVTLAKNLCLRINDQVIVPNSCTSVRITSSFIVYTTTDNLLHFLAKTNIYSDKDIKDDLIYSQPIENGALLISACESSLKIVLQMPRGNLETIYPRIFVLKKIMTLLYSENYVDACKLAKRHRINMNFLVDYIMKLKPDPLTKSNLVTFIDKVVEYDPALLCVVLTELDHSDTISGRYGCVSHDLVDFQLKTSLEGKVNQFCELVSSLHNPKYLQPRIQSLLKMEPRRTEDAIRIIYNIEDKTSRKEAIRFMLYFIDIEELFKRSLCTYNTDITLMVADSSNKDPKLYLTFIDELKNSNEVIELKHYKIDLYIKRYDEAFKNLFAHRINLEKQDTNKKKLDEIDEELIELITSKKIYRVAVRSMELEEGLEDLKAVIWANYANYLLQKRHYEESGCAYSKAYTYSGLRKNYDLALTSYAFVNDWEKSIALIARSSVDGPVKVESLERISRRLLESGECEKAYLVLAQPDHNLVPKVITTLIDNSSWYLVEFLSSKDEMKDLKAQIISDISKRLKTYLDDTLSVVIEAKEHFKRLESIRKESIKNPKEVLHYISDTVSTVDGSDVSSLSESSQAVSKTKSGATSIKTRSSSKSQANITKRITLKKGSRYEDLALIVELRQFILNQSTMQEEASKLISAAYEYCPLEYASSENENLHKVLNDSLKEAIKIYEKLWQPVETEENLSVIKRIERYFLSTDRSSTLENIDFQVCIKPALPKQVTCFDL